MPIYLVKTNDKVRLVQADLKSVAINHVIRSTVTAETLTAEELLEFIKDGVTVEQAVARGAEPQTQEDKPND
jgi:hypothetical protein